MLSSIFYEIDVTLGYIFFPVFKDGKIEKLYVHQLPNLIILQSILILDDGSVYQLYTHSLTNHTFQQTIQAWCVLGIFQLRFNRKLRRMISFTMPAPH